MKEKLLFTLFCLILIVHKASAEGLLDLVPNRVEVTSKVMEPNPRTIETILGKVEIGNQKTVKIDHRYLSDLVYKYPHSKKSSNGCFLNDLFSWGYHPSDSHSAPKDPKSNYDYGIEDLVYHYPSIWTFSEDDVKKLDEWNALPENVEGRANFFQRIWDGIRRDGYVGTTD